MNKKVIVIVAIVLVAIAGGLAYLLTSDNGKQAKEEMIDDTSVQQSPDDGPNVQVLSPTNPGTYIDYKDGIIASTAGTKLLFFHAAWCPQCRALEADIKEKGVPANTTIIKVDYDTSQSLRQKYGVTLQTTLVKVDDNGNLVKKYVAYDDPTLEAVAKNLL